VTKKDTFLVHPFLGVPRRRSPRRYWISFRAIEFHERVPLGLAPPLPLSSLCRCHRHFHRGTGFIAKNGYKSFPDGSLTSSVFQEILRTDPSIFFRRRGTLKFFGHKDSSREIARRTSREIACDVRVVDFMRGRERKI